MFQKRTVLHGPQNTTHPAQMPLIMILYRFIIYLVHLITVEPLPRLNSHEFCFVFGKHTNHEKVLVMVTCAYSNRCSYESADKGSDDTKFSGSKSFGFFCFNEDAKFPPK